MNPTGASSILLIEDTASLQMLYRSVLNKAGHIVHSASSGAEARDLIVDAKPDLVLLDLVLPDEDGLELMRLFLADHPGLRVIVMTAHGSISRAVETMRAGAHEFLVKPFDEVRLLAAIANALGHEAPKPRPARPAPRPNPEPAKAPSGDFIGSSVKMAEVHATIAAVATSMATVFITGESGTGKELCAVAVHGKSPRSKGPFIALNCGAIPQDLLESEVFGHMKGSFTGAISDKPGAAQAADGGTLFLDEVCEMPPALQTKLLRFLQTSTITPVGATRPRSVNVRIICATNRDPAEEVRRGHFREDLFYRLFVLPIHMPPLRERQDDVVEIAAAALDRFGIEEGKQFEGLAPDVKEIFRLLPWPGNVRQVLNVIRNVVVLNQGGMVSADMLPNILQVEIANTAALVPSAKLDSTEMDDLIGRPLAEIERMVIEATLDKHNGSVPKAARMLELSPSTLYRKIEGWAKS